jgi:hypothetical protein|tara:strand:- start:7 stop:225 length:219 start_codon:yes stop_codon:yes gene_type:complete
MRSEKEILAQRQLLDTMLAARISDREREQTLKLMDTVYFRKNLPDNVIPFPLHKVRRLNVTIPAKQPGKKNI